MIEDNREFILWEILPEKDFKELNRLFEGLAFKAGDFAEKVGIVPFRKYTSEAFANLGKRYFKMKFVFRGKPFKILRQEVVEKDKQDYDKGIERLKNDPSKTTGWVEL